MATVNDPAINTNVLGLVTCGAAVCCTALFQVSSTTEAPGELLRGRRQGAVLQVWAGSMQKQLQASSMQLMHQYAPWAALLLGCLVPIFEPIGPGDGTLLSYPYTPAAVTVLASTAVLVTASLEGPFSRAAAD